MKFTLLLFAFAIGVGATPLFDSLSGSGGLTPPKHELTSFQDRFILHDDSDHKGNGPACDFRWGNHVHSPTSPSDPPADPPAATPEPGTLALFVSGLGMVVAFRKRKCN